MHVPTIHLVVGIKAERCAGGARALQELCDWWGLKPHRKAKGFVFYEVGDIEAAIDRRDRSGKSY